MKQKKNKMRNLKREIEEKYKLINLKIEFV
jgi:hypothetical protein